MKAVLTAAAALALFTAPAFAQNDTTTDSLPEIVPGVENNDSDTDAVSVPGSVSGDNVDANDQTALEALTGPDAEAVNVYVLDNRLDDTVIETAPVVGGTLGDDVVLTPVEGYDRYSYIYYEGRPVIVDSQTRSVVSLGEAAGMEQAVGGSIGVTGTDAGESATPSGGVVPGQAQQ